MIQLSCYILDYFWDEFFFPRKHVADIQRMGVVMHVHHVIVVEQRELCT